MNLDNVPKQQGAVEWDMGWFCDRCDTLRHWGEEAYILNNRKYCEDCAKRIIEDKILK